MLAEQGKFSAGLCLGIGAAAGVAVFALIRRASLDPLAPKERALRKLHGLAALLIAGSTLFSTKDAGELLSGGWDPGVYLHTGAQISQTGSLMNRDMDLLKMTADESAILRRHHPGGMSGPFSGMWTVPAGGVSPQFHHLYPALLAVAHSLGGVRGELLVNPLLNVLCLLAFYALALRFVRAPFALAAAAVLAFNPAQIWQAKFCTAEMLGQLLIFGGAVCFLAAQEAAAALARRTLACLAGIAVGLAFLARFDSIIFLAPFLALTLAAWRWLPHRDSAVFLLLGLTPCAIHHFIRQPIFSPYYTPMGNLVGPAIAALLGISIALALVSRIDAVRDYAERRASWLRTAAVAGFALWSVFIWLRPFLPPLPLTSADPELQEMLRADANNCFFLSAIFGFGVPIYFVALGLLLFTERSVVRAVWVYSSTAVLLVVATALFNDHYIMWGTRRFVPVVVPLFILAFAWLLERVAGSASSRPRSFIAAALLILVVGLNISATFAMQRLRDWPGLAAWHARVAASVPADAKLFSDQWGFTSPQRFLHGKHAFELHLSEKDPTRRDRLLAVMNTAVARGEKVYFLTMKGPLGNCAERGSFPLQSARLNTSTKSIPRTTRPAGGDFMLYEILSP